MKVILVGNSPDLLKSNYGQLIDSFDVVIRMNHFETKGFENHVGTKTDWYGVAWATPEKKPFDQFKKVIMYTGPDNIEGYEPQQNEEIFRAIDYEFMHYIYQFKKEYSQPSMGAAIVYYLISKLGIHPYLIGFDYFGLKNNHPDFGHYYTDERHPRERAFLHHEPDKEMYFIESMHLGGILTIIDHD